MAFLFFFSSGSQPYPITGSSTSGRSGFLVTLCFFPHRPPPFPFTASFFLSTSMPSFSSSSSSSSSLSSSSASGISSQHSFSVRPMKGRMKERRKLQSLSAVPPPTDAWMAACRTEHASRWQSKDAYSSVRSALSDTILGG